MKLGFQVGVGLVCLAALIAGGLFLVRPDEDLNAAAAEVEQTLAEAKRRGFPLTAKEIDPRPGLLRDEDNAAPEIARLSALMQADPDFSKRVADLRQAVVANVYAAEPGLSQFRLQFDVIEKACAKSTYYVLREWDFGPMLSIEDVSSLRAASRLMCYRAEIRAANGQVDAAIDDLNRAKKLCEFTASGTLLMGELLASFCEMGRATTIRRIALHWQHDAAKLERLHALLEQPVADPDLRAVVRSKAYGSIAFLRNFRALGGAAAFNQDPNMRGTIVTPGDPSKLVKEGIPDNKFERANLTSALRYYLSLADVVDRPDFTLAQFREALRAANDKVKRAGRSATVIAEMAMPDVTYLQLYMGETQRRLTLAYLEMMSERARTGKFPLNLAQSHIDPYSGRPLRCVSDGEKFRVWSVGSDLKDDDGLRKPPSTRFFDDVVEFPTQPPRIDGPRPAAGSRI